MNDEAPDPELSEIGHRDIAAVHAQFPDAEQPGTALYNLVSATIAKLQAENPAFFGHPMWRLRVTRVVAAQMRRDAILLN